MPSRRDSGAVQRRRSGAAGRVVALLLVVWLVIGVIAAAQRHYFSGSATNCAKVGTIAVTILAGPLNYLGVNPKIKCSTPQPSN
jgi:nitric oxide reductase large subunit